MINFPLIAKPRCNDGDNDNVEIIKRIILAEKFIVRYDKYARTLQVASQ